MFYDDIKLVEECIKKYGLLYPAVDLGGLARPTIADYDITIRGGSQTDRYLTLNHPPFQESLGNYTILNPDKGDPEIEKLPMRDHWGTIVCVSVLEHVENPFSVFDGFYKLLKPGGLLILSTEFSFPYHPSPADNWRFSPSGLEILAKHSGLSILECGWRLKITGDMGVKEIHTGKPQEIFSTYIICRK